MCVHIHFTGRLFSSCLHGFTKFPLNNLSGASDQLQNTVVAHNTPTHRLIWEPEGDETRLWQVLRSFSAFSDVRGERKRTFQVLWTDSGSQCIEQLTGALTVDSLYKKKLPQSGQQSTRIRKEINPTSIRSKSTEACFLTTIPSPYKSVLSYVLGDRWTVTPDDNWSDILSGRTSFHGHAVLGINPLKDCHFSKKCLRT